MITLSGFRCLTKSQLNFHKSFISHSNFVYLFTLFYIVALKKKIDAFLLFYAMCRRQNPGGMNENPSAPVANVAEA
jgi:hypothetical protein